MATRLANATRNAACNAVVDLLNSGTINFYTATPTDVDDADSGTLLGTCTFAATAFGDASEGVATAAAIVADSSADDSGTAVCARIKTSAAALHSDTDCGDGSGSINFDNNVIVAGGTIAISNYMTWTQPA